jgi:hypothetical protein
MAPIIPEDLHPHLRARMEQRGVTQAEIERTLDNGWEARDAKQGMSGKVMVFEYNAAWEGHWFPEKEVTVYYKAAAGRVILLTVKARYGQSFPRS